MQIGTLLGALVAEGVLPLQSVAAQIADARPADGDPEFDEGLVDSGDALAVLGGLAAEVGSNGWVANHGHGTDSGQGHDDEFEGSVNR